MKFYQKHKRDDKIHRCSRVPGPVNLMRFGINGNERWTVNLVPARITRRAGAPPLKIFEIFEILEKFEISTENVNFSKPLNPIELFSGIIISLFY